VNQATAVERCRFVSAAVRPAAAASASRANRALWASHEHRVGRLARCDQHFARGADRRLFGYELRRAFSG
jgi:hypothetical protein